MMMSVQSARDLREARTQCRTLLRYKVHCEQELFDTAYEYIREY